MLAKSKSKTTVELAALEQAVGSKSATSEESDRHFVIKSVLDQASRLTLQDHLPQACLDLIATLLPQEQSQPRAQILRLTALGFMGGGAEFDDLLSTLARKPKILPVVREQFFKLLRQRHLPLTSETYRILWGAEPDDIFKVLNNPIPGSAFVRATPDLFETIRAVGGDITNPEFYMNRLRLGLQRSHYIKFLREHSNLSTGTGAVGFAGLRKQLERLFIAPDISPLTKLLDRGETIVVLQCHSGYLGLVARWLSKIAFPLSRVSDMRVSRGLATTPDRMTFMSQQTERICRFALWDCAN